MISIHALREEGDPAAIGVDVQGVVISIHALREEGDSFSLSSNGTVNLFLSTPSARRATCIQPDKQQCSDISIHALREEGDLNSLNTGTGGADFYPRPPRGGRPYGAEHDAGHGQHFYPRPPRGGRRLRHLQCHSEHGISIHALREEGDFIGAVEVVIFAVFLSTPSARRATSAADDYDEIFGISIHALREEGDWPASATTTPPLHFYPRPPRGGRLSVLCKDADFLDISIHALREEGDSVAHPFRLL